MKKHISSLLIAYLLLTGCTDHAADRSIPESEMPSALTVSSETLEPADEPEEADEPPPFGSLLYVADTDDPLLQSGLSFFGLEGAENAQAVYEALNEADHIFRATEERSLSNWHGYSTYAFDGYTMDFIMTGPFGAPEEDLGRAFGLITLFDEKYELECGFHVGMALEEARTVLDKEGVKYWEFALADIVPIPHTVEEESLEGSLLAWHEYTQPEKLFENYVYCLAFPYQPNPDTLGRSLCLYTDAEGTVGAISSAFWTLP